MGSSIKYAIVARKNTITGEVRAYANIVNDTLSFDDIARQVTEETTVTDTDCRAVLSAFVSIMKREIIKGNEIRLDKLGTIYPTLASEGAEEVEKFVTSMIKKVNLRFRPATELLKEVQKASFTLAPTKKFTHAAIKDMKDAVQEAIDEGDEGGDEPQP